MARRPTLQQLENSLRVHHERLLGLLEERAELMLEATEVAHAQGGCEAASSLDERSDWSWLCLYRAWRQIDWLFSAVDHEASGPARRYRRGALADLAEHAAWLPGEMGGSRSGRRACDAIVETLDGTISALRAFKRRLREQGLDDQLTVTDEEEVGLLLGCLPERGWGGENVTMWRPRHLVPRRGLKPRPPGSR